MSDLMDLKRLIHRGAPANGAEARQIIRVAMESADRPAEDWEKRLSSALTEILVGRQLHSETYKARADALAVLNEIEGGHSPAPAKPRTMSRH